MDNFDIELAELEAKKLAILAKQKKEKDDYENSKSVVVTVVDFVNGFYCVRQNISRNNLVIDLFSSKFSITDRTYHIAYSKYKDFAEYISHQKNVILIYPHKKLDSLVAAYENKPDIVITVSADKLLYYVAIPEEVRNAKGNPIIASVLADKARYIHKDTWTVASMDVESLALWIKDVELRYKLEIDKDSKEELFAKVERAATLDLLASAQDTDLVLDMNGFQLKEFQKVGVKFVDVALKDSIGCLVADEMGLGKTIQYLAYCKLNGLRNLAIVPPALIENWSREIISKCGVVPRVFLGTSPSKFDVEDMLFPNKQSQYNIIGYSALSAGVVDEKKNDAGWVINREKKYPWAQLIAMAGFKVIGLDEVHKIKNSESGRSQGTRSIDVKEKGIKVIGLSGTPILNRPLEFWPFLNWIGVAGGEKDFTYRYSDGKNGVNRYNLPELHKKLKPVMIRRLKKDVIKELPAIINEYQYNELNENQRRIYNQLEAGVRDELNKVDWKKSNAMMDVLTMIMRLKQFCASLNVNYTADYAVEVYDENEGTEHRKVIIFSQFINTAHHIHKRLGHESLYFDGTVSPAERMKIVDQFQTDDSKHFLSVSTKSASEGLNITAAGHVIFNDLLWTPADHDQAIGRAYGRLSDCHGVVAHWMIVKNTIMHWIQELLDEKSVTIDATVDGVKGERTQSSIAMAIVRRLRGK